MEDVSVWVVLPPGTKGGDLKVKMTGTEFRVALKSDLNNPIVEGKWNKKIMADDSLWTIERDGGKVTLNATLVKYQKQTWWNCLLEGDIEIDT